jgi:hypothetical protein
VGTFAISNNQAEFATFPNDGLERVHWAPKIDSLNNVHDVPPGSEHRVIV